MEGEQRNIRKYLGLAALTVLLIAAMSGPRLLRSRVAELEIAARALLSASAYEDAFRGVAVSFAGQEATLTGTVGSDADRALAAEIIRNQVRIPGGLAGGRNPVIAVHNEIIARPARSEAHPKPWLAIFLLGGKAELHGCANSAGQAGEIIAAVRLSLPEIDLANTVTVSPDTAAPGDWPATGANVPDRTQLTAIGALGAFFFTECDGRWTTVDGALDADAQADVLAKEGVAPSLAKSVAADFIAWRDREAEAARIAALPVARAGLLFLPTRLLVQGTVSSEPERKSLIAALQPRFPGVKIADELTVAPSVRPGADWNTALSSLPVEPKPVMIAGLMPETHAAVWDGRGGEPAMRKSLAPFTGKTGGLVPGLRAQYSVWEKANTRAKTATRTAPAPRSPKPQATGKISSYVGWTFADSKVSLFGIVPEARRKRSVIETAKRTFPGMTINADGLKVSVPPRAPLTAMVHFKKLPSPPRPLIGIATFDGQTRIYSPGTPDEKIARDFRNVPIEASDLGATLAPFREKVVREAPYLSLLADGKALRVSGEVAAEGDKSSLLLALRQHTQGLNIIDQIQVTNLVAESGDMKPTLDSVPVFAPGESGVATVRPGQQWRVAVVHAIYFQSASDRSADQERALAQMREVLKVLPDAKFEVIGNSDAVGSMQANFRLSAERAQTVATYLTDAGIPAEIISASGAGSAEPIAGNDTEDGRALNRRVDVILH